MVRSVTAYDVFLEDCPARTTLSVIGDAWSAVVIVALNERPRQYTELRARIGGISKTMLTRTLRRLGDHGLVRMSPDRERRYELTALGESLLPPVVALVEWAEAHTGELLDHIDQQRGNGSVPSPSLPSQA